MAQDTDIARVAAAMNTPGFKYRSFGNEPVRIRPGAAGTLALSMPMLAPEAPPELSYMALPEPHYPTHYPTHHAPQHEPHHAPQHEPHHAPQRDAGFATLPEMGYAALPEPAPAQQPRPEAAPHAVQASQPMPEPFAMRSAPDPVAAAVPLFSWPETTAAHPAHPAPSLIPGLHPPAAPALDVAMQMIAPEAAAGGFRLLEAIGHRPEDQGGAAIGNTALGTLGMLRHAVDAAPHATTMAGLHGGFANQPHDAQFAQFGGREVVPAHGLLPAAAVTVPLSDVMRLIAAGATPPPSPFDAFRIALGAQPGR